MSIDCLPRLPIDNKKTEFDEPEVGFKIFKCKKLSSIDMSYEQNKDAEIEVKLLSC